MRDAAGTLLYYEGTTEDISARKRAEAEIEKLALVARETDNTVILTDAAGRIEWVNAGFTRLTGYPLDEVKGRKPGSFLQGPNTNLETVRLVRERLAAGIERMAKSLTRATIRLRKQRRVMRIILQGQMDSGSGRPTPTSCQHILTTRQ